MTNEKPWWWSVWLSRLWGGETDSDPTNYRAIASIVAEAERRGEVKAWEEAKMILVPHQQFAADHPYREVRKKLFKAVEDKLTSLKTP